MSKIWITKWALTKGIIATDAVIKGDIASSHRYGVFLDHQFYTSEDDAIRRAIQMREAKIKNTENLLIRLHNMKFIKGGDSHE